MTERSNDASSPIPLLQAADAQQNSATEASVHSKLVSDLTHEVELGHGCALKPVLQAMPFEESIKTIKEVAAQFKEDRRKDPSLPEVIFASSGDGWEAHAGLYKSNSQDWWRKDYSLLVRDQLAIDDSHEANVGDRSGSCSNLDYQTK